MDIRGQTILVTGGAVRIGRAIVEALAAAGCRVVIHCQRSVAEARDLAAALQAQGTPAWVAPGRLQTEGDCARLLDRAWRVAGRVDGLINNAAVFHKNSLRTTTAASLATELRINLCVPILLTRGFAVRARTGQVINLLDRRIAGNDEGCVPYLLSKKALADFTRVAALELAPRIRVNGVAPGAVLPPPGKGAAYLKDRAGRVPLGRQIVPADVARAVVALLQLEGVTGQVLFVDGGQHLLGNGV